MFLLVMLSRVAEMVKQNTDNSVSSCLDGKLLILPGSTESAMAVQAAKQHNLPAKLADKNQTVKQ